MEDDVVFAVMISCIGGLMFFGILTVLGRHLVRMLRLPTDLPPDCLFDPPAPDLAPSGDPAAAHKRAHVQNKRRDLYARAYTACTQAFEIGEYAGALTDQQAAQRLSSLAESVKQPSEALQLAMALPNLSEAEKECAPHFAAITAAWNASEQDRNAVPEPSKRILYILLIALLALLLFNYVLHTLTPSVP